MKLFKAPQALLDLFRLRTEGLYPTVFGESVQPTVDSASFYGSDLQATGSANGSAGALPRSQTAVTGRSARYLGLAGSVVVGAAPGTQLQLSLGVLVQSASFFPLFSTAVLTAQALRTYYVGGLFACPVVFPAGTTFQVIVAGDAGGADHNTSLFTFLEDPVRA